MASIQANGIDVHVEERGSGAPLVLLHGFTGNAATWSPVRDLLARRHRVIAIDLIGHGATSAPADPSRYAFERALDDLTDIADQLGIDRATWLGYSMGGRLTLGLALRRPERVSALILESATPGIQDAGERSERKAADERLAQRIEEIGVEAFIDEWERLPMWESQRTLPAEVLQHQREHRLRNSAIGLANSLRGMGQGAQPSYWDRLGDLQIPVLLIAGAHDRKFVGIAEQMGVSIPGATYSVVSSAGHAVHLERPQHFAGEVREFLGKRESLMTGKIQERSQWT